MTANYLGQWLETKMIFWTEIIFTSPEQRNGKFTCANEILEDFRRTFKLCFPSWCWQFYELLLVYHFFVFFLFSYTFIYFKFYFLTWTDSFLRYYVPTWHAWFKELLESKTRAIIFLHLFLFKASSSLVLLQKPPSS